MNEKYKKIALSAYILTAAYLSTVYNFIGLVGADFILAILVAILLNSFLAYLIWSSDKTRKYSAIILTILLLLAALHLLPVF